MKLLNSWGIEETNGKYEVHLLGYKNRKEWGIWSTRNKIYLKDTTRYGKENRGLMGTYGITIGEDCIQKRMYLKDILVLCEIPREIW